MRDEHRSVVAIALASGLFMVAGGLWSLLAPRSFADFVDFPPFNEHFLHDLGAFQLAIGVTLLLAPLWRDALALALAGFLVGNTVHAVNHAVDRDIGGNGNVEWISLTVLSLVVAWGLSLRLSELGFVVGHVGSARVPELERFVAQKTIVLTSYRKDGRPVGAPVSIAVDGDRAFVRSPGNGGKIKRIRNNPEVEIAPSTGRGRPTGPALRCRATEVAGADWRTAGRLLRRKHPLLHGVFVPAIHHLFRKRFGPTVHLELVVRTSGDG